MSIASKPLTIKSKNDTSKKTVLDGFCFPENGIENTPQSPDLEGGSWKVTNITDALYSKSDKQARREARYTGLGYAQHLLIEANVTNTTGTKGHRTRACQRQLRYAASHVDIKLSRNELESEAIMNGLFTCDSVWACPVCASRKAAQYAHEIGQAIDWAIVNKYTVLMVTLTAKHSKDMSLNLFKSKFKEAWTYFRDSRTLKNLRKKIGAKYRIMAREATHGDYLIKDRDNGWHYHMHLLEFALTSVFMSNEFDSIVDELQDIWLTALKKAGLSAARGIGLKVSAKQGTKKDYLAKLGLGAGDTLNRPDLEATGSQQKDSLTHWKLLDRARRGDEHAAELFVEFVRSMTGDNWITWSRGFKKLVGLEEPTAEELEALEAESTQFDDFMSLTAEEYGPVAITRNYAGLLSIAAETRDENRVYQFLDSESAAAGLVLYSQIRGIEMSVRVLMDELSRHRIDMDIARKLTNPHLKAKKVTHHSDSIMSIETKISILEKRKEKLIRKQILFERLE